MKNCADSYLGTLSAKDNPCPSLLHTAPTNPRHLDSLDSMHHGCEELAGLLFLVALAWVSLGG